MRTALLCIPTLAVSVGLSGLAGAQKPPFADGPEAPAVEPRPPVRTWGVEEKPFALALTFTPGIPEVGKVAEVSFKATETPKVPHPRFGSSVPLMDAKLIAELYSPAGELLARYRTHPVPLTQSQYAFHFTPTVEGIHEMRVTGKLADGRQISLKLDVPVDVWPLPEKLQGEGLSSTSRRGPVRRGGPVSN